MIIREKKTDGLRGNSAKFSDVVADKTGRITRQVAEIACELEPEDRYIPSARETLRVSVRFDDSCGNGHESLGVTASYPGGGGCCHELILKYFPELEPLVKFHLCRTDGPMHYIANTVYLAGDRDYRGLKKGESQPLLRGGKPGAFCYEWNTSDGLKPYELPKADDFEGDYIILHKVKTMIKGEGKERELEAARRSAIWPEATDEELKQEPEDLKAALAARLPGLLEEFRNAVEESGLLWPQRIEED